MLRPPSRCCFRLEEAKTQGSKDVRTEIPSGFPFNAVVLLPPPRVVFRKECGND